MTPQSSTANPGGLTPRISVIVPTYNEAKNLPHVFGLLPDDLHEVIVVDGHSVDGTIETALELRPDVVIVRQNRRGKGNALACGFAVATGDVIVMLDADGSADPREITRYVAALIEGADFAKGTRFDAGGGSADITPTRAWGNRWLNRAVNVLFGTTYTDLCYGYNAFWAHCLPALHLDASDTSKDGKLWGDGFEIETIINTRVAKAGLRIAEVPSFEFERIHGESNLNTWRDGCRVLRALLVEKVNGVGRGARIDRRRARTLQEAALEFEVDAYIPAQDPIRPDDHPEPADVVLAANTVLPANVVLPANTVLPLSSVVPASNVVDLVPNARNPRTARRGGAA